MWFTFKYFVHSAERITFSSTWKLCMQTSACNILSASMKIYGALGHECLCTAFLRVQKIVRLRATFRLNKFCHRRRSFSCQLGQIHEVTCQKWSGVQSKTKQKLKFKLLRFSIECNMDFRKLSVAAENLSVVGAWWRQLTKRTKTKYSHRRFSFLLHFHFNY